jgi:ABC-type transport system involved in multi-copper enzyme maturation permease subunit
MPVFLRWFLRLGPTNPIAVRLVQNGSRRTKHMYVRAAYLAVLIATLLWLLLRGTGSALSYRELAMAASGAFEAISYLQIFLICVLAPVFMAGAIAQESSPRTWEVLLTTPMTAVQIVLGNLFGRLFFVVALLAASLPLFALTQYFGGVPGSSIFLSYLIAACAALLVGAIAIALAVSRVAGKRAVFVFYVAVVSYLALTIALDAFLRQSRGSPGVTVVTALNPFLTLRALLNPSTYPKAPEGSQVGIAAWLLESPVRTWCVGSSLLSVVFMLGSTLTVRAGGLQTLAAGSGRVPWYRKIFGFGAAGAEHRAPRSVWHNPIAWREGAARNATLGKTIARWSFVGMGGVFGAVLVVIYHAGNLTHSSFQLAIAATVGAELAVITLVAINTAGTAISREREDGTLDLLLTTPITASAYLWGKLRGLIAYLLPLLAVPLGTLFIAGLYVMTGGMGREGGVEVPWAAATPNPAGAPVPTLPVLIPESGLFAPLAVIPFVAFCVMVGLNWSLRMKGTIGSVVATVGVVGAIAGVVGLCGWQAGRGIPVVGPAVAALSPASLLAAVIDPSDALGDTVSRHGLTTARISLAVGCAVAGIVWAAVCYGIHSNMVRTFDMTVRKLAGQK